MCEGKRRDDYEKREGYKIKISEPMRIGKMVKEMRKRRCWLDSNMIVSFLLRQTNKNIPPQTADSSLQNAANLTT